MSRAGNSVHWMAVTFKDWALKSYSSCDGMAFKVIVAREFQRCCRLLSTMLMHYKSLLLGNLSKF